MGPSILIPPCCSRWNEELTSPIPSSSSSSVAIKVSKEKGNRWNTISPLVLLFFPRYNQLCRARCFLFPMDPLIRIVDGSAIFPGQQQILLASDARGEEGRATIHSRRMNEWRRGAKENVEDENENGEEKTTSTPFRATCDVRISGSSMWHSEKRTHDCCWCWCCSPHIRPQQCRTQCWPTFSINGQRPI